MKTKDKRVKTLQYFSFIKRWKLLNLYLNIWSFYYIFGVIMAELNAKSHVLLLNLN